MNQVKIIVLTFECNMKTTYVLVILALTPIDRVRDHPVTKIDSGTILKPCMFLNLILVYFSRRTAVQKAYDDSYVCQLLLNDSSTLA